MCVCVCVVQLWLDSMWVYGGYSQICGDYCSDLWQYNISRPHRTTTHTPLTLSLPVDLSSLTPSPCALRVGVCCAGAVDGRGRGSWSAINATAPLGSPGKSTTHNDSEEREGEWGEREREKEVMSIRWETGSVVDCRLVSLPRVLCACGGVCVCVCVSGVGSTWLR